MPDLPDLPDPVLWAVPGFIALIAAEMIYGRLSGRTQFEPRDSATSLIMGLGNSVSGLLVGFIGLAWLTYVSQHAVFDIGWAWWAWPVCFVLDDFVYYWWHRASHRIRWFWADHVVHHSSQHYNLTTALRQPWTGAITLSYVVFGTWLVLLGFPVAMVAFVSALNLVYQFWIHTEAIKRMPRWFEAVFNTPSHHRVHHATNPRYLDKNYAGVFIVWDRMFGTFEPERDEEPCRYGVVRNLNTFNPVKVAFHEWWGIAKDVAGAKSLSEAIQFVVRPPGWTPDGSRDTSDTLKARWRSVQEAEPADAPETEADAARQRPQPAE